MTQYARGLVIGATEQDLGLRHMDLAYAEIALWIKYTRLGKRRSVMHQLHSATRRQPSSDHYLCRDRVHLD
ncbi:unannotated protein [freshwater metagenome]|uniref:Unannotated protein n=1 Tax=freshwater metagenome TaxID=449393 RepID=A0A6J7IE55_9ZZZZ